MQQQLIELAQAVRGEFALAKEGASAGAVGCALMTEGGSLFTGICLDVTCGIGFCAEHAAIAEMLKNRETRIDCIVAVGPNRVLTPCGRCRELMLQVNYQNLHTRVIIDADRTLTLGDLLPHPWF